MRITKISVYQATLSITGGDYHWYGGKRILNKTETTVVRMETDGGIEGYGEICPIPGYLPAYSGGIVCGIAELAPHLLGQDPRQVERIVEIMDFVLQGHNYVKTPLDVACWDILGKSVGMPVYMLLGGRLCESIPLHHVVGVVDPAETPNVVAGLREQGYWQFQLKLGNVPAEDAERVRAVAAELQPGERLFGDANGAWTVDQAIRFAQACGDADYFFEQPCGTYEECLTIRRRVSQPLKLDEIVQSVADLVRGHADNAYDVVTVKNSKCGGLTKARRSRDFCVEMGIPMAIEEIWGSEIATAAQTHLGISTQERYVLSAADVHNWVDEHVGKSSLTVENGRISIGDEPGLGVEPDFHFLGDPVAVFKA